MKLENTQNKQHSDFEEVDLKKDSVESQLLDGASKSSRCACFVFNHEECAKWAERGAYFFLGGIPASFISGMAKDSSSHFPISLAIAIVCTVASCSLAFYKVCVVYGVCKSKPFVNEV